MKARVIYSKIFPINSICINSKLGGKFYICNNDLHRHKLNVHGKEKSNCSKISAMFYFQFWLEFHINKYIIYNTLVDYNPITY